jgi:hypothetical protein
MMKNHIDGLGGMRSNTDANKSSVEVQSALLTTFDYRQILPLGKCFRSNVSMTAVKLLADGF